MSEQVPRTLILIKPDAVSKGHVGAIIGRFEGMGFHLVAMKLVWPTPELARRHLPESEEWIRELGEKRISGIRQYGLDPLKELGSDDVYEIGRLLKQANIDFLASGRVVAMIWQGPDVIADVRKEIGSAVPDQAKPGTIRRVFSRDSGLLAARQRRCVQNVVHASSDPDEAEREIRVWFRPEEIIDVPRPV